LRLLRRGRRIAGHSVFLISTSAAHRGSQSLNAQLIPKFVLSLKFSRLLLPLPYQVLAPVMEHGTSIEHHSKSVTCESLLDRLQQFL
jgi:hypothetical protein